MTTLCAITGTLRDLTGTVLTNTQVTFVRSGVAGQDGSTIVPRTVAATSNGSGVVTVTLYAGNYTATTIGADTGTVTFSVAVPTTATAVLSDLIDAAPTTVTSQMAVDAQAAEVAAQAAQAAAEAAQVGAAASAAQLAPILSVGSYTLASGVLTIDYSGGATVIATLTQNVTSIVVNNWPVSGDVGKLNLGLLQDGTGGRTVAYPAAWRWPNNSAPSVTSTLNKIDWLVAVTTDAGATVFAFNGGQNL